MALLFMDGFDAGDFTTKWSGYSGAIGLFNTVPRYGTGRYIVLDSTNDTMSKVITASSKVYLGFAAKFEAYGGTAFAHFQGDNGTLNHILIVTTGSGALNISRGAEGTILASSPAGVILLNVWNYIEISATVHDTTGTVEVRLNGVMIASFTGDTRNGGTSTLIDRVVLRGYGASDLCIDDLYICNDTGSAPYNTFLGDVRVAALVPSGAGSDTGFAPSSGANYTAVDELPYSATDYVTATAAGTRDLYTMSDLAGSYSVLAVQNNIIAKKTDAGGTAIKSAIKSGGVVYYGSNSTLASSDMTFTDLRTVDPATSTAWTLSGVNSMEAGVEIA